MSRLFMLKIIKDAVPRRHRIVSGLTVQLKPEKIRVSLGTAAVLGLERCTMSSAPTTAYFMTYVEGRCIANCAFCAQAHESSSDLSLLSRIEWPEHPFDRVLEALQQKRSVFQRICLQALNFPGFQDEIYRISEHLILRSRAPLSLCAPPLIKQHLERLYALGTDRICFALDASTQEIFENIKGRKVNGPYSWEKHWAALNDAVKVFGKGRVTTHLIVGLGETEEELLSSVQRLKDLGILASLFAFTPISGTKLGGQEKPSVGSYRRLQLGRYLINGGIRRAEEMSFKDGVLKSLGTSSDSHEKILASGEAFQTCGCPGCNRPFYNETPRGPIYNYSRSLTYVEVKEAISELGVK